MPLFSFMKEFFKPRHPREFSLGKRGQPGIPRAREDVVQGKHQERPPYASPAAKKASDQGVWASIRKRGSAEAPRPSDTEAPNMTPFGGMSREEREVLGSDLSRSIDENLKAIGETFHWPRNAGLVVRQFRVKKTVGSTKAALLYLAGLIDEAAVREHLLEPLLRPSQAGKGVDVSIQSLMERDVAQLQVKVATKLAHVAAAIVEGESVLLIDGDKTALACGTRSPEHRAVSESPTEAVVRGPHSGFVENLKVNIAQIRINLASPKLIAESLYVGARGHTSFSILYLEGVANPKLVAEVRRRITSLRTDVVSCTAVLVNQIQDSPLDPFPTYLATERPDMCANMIAEGHVAILSSSPTAILLPATVWSMMHSSEDYYINFVPATFIRLLRWLALFTTIYASAIYVAVVTYHPSMLPTELLYAIAATREAVPFPAALEVTAMEVAFELIREAGIRIPTIVGPTIGIVGAVILGQAAVQASIVSPILVVIVAVSGLGAFAIPNYNLELYVRLIRFVMIASAAVLGIPGLALASLCLIAHISGKRSFGVPLTAPLIPNWPHSPDVIFQGPLANMKRRPGHTRPLDIQRQKDGAGVQGPYPARPFEEDGEGKE